MGSTQLESLCVHKKHGNKVGGTRSADLFSEFGGFAFDWMESHGKWNAAEH